MHDPVRGHEALQFIADGVTEIAGFEIAVISAVHDGVLETLAVSGDASVREILYRTRTPASAVLDELEDAEDWGLLKFVPHDKRSGSLDGYAWESAAPPAAGPTAWHPKDMLIALLSDDQGLLRGVLSIDLPTTGLRPELDQRRTLETYARQAGQAIVMVFERDELDRRVRAERELLMQNKRLIATITHELKNPITVISANLEMLGVVADAAGRATVTGAMRRGTDRLSALVSELLELARAETEVLPDDGVVDLHDIASSVCEAFRRDMGAPDISLELIVPTSPLPVRGSAVELRRVLENLLSNAHKYSPQGGVVAVELEIQAEGRVLLHVSDHGIGISEDDQLHIFEEFFRSEDNFEHEIVGTGLGLSIVQRIATRYGGSARVDSSRGRGSRFTVELPLATQGTRRGLPEE